MSIQSISLALIDAHPDNPRLSLREDVIGAIAGQLKEAPYDKLHAIVVRKLGRRYETIDGHHRIESARRAGLKKIPAWIRKYSDADALLQLAIANMQSGLTPLERGRHALTATTKYGKNRGLSIAQYAKRMGYNTETTVRQQIAAYAVFAECADICGLEKYYQHLMAIHAAPRAEWPALAQRLVDEDWTVEQIEAAVAALTESKPARRGQSLKREDAMTLDEWENLHTDLEIGMLGEMARERYGHTFNEQDSDSIEWAKWSWNPVTGCLHNCPYCYARDIAERFYPQKFAPAIWPKRLSMPYETSVPKEAERDISFRNVFTCSMADLFGKWVPRKWIETVLEIVAENPQWNFL